jgi:prepilin signal peptidase PulO-like enzyme (type II secretory pathway)
LNNLLPALGAALLGALAGVAIHRFNDLARRGEEEAVEPPLPAEPYWAPLLGAGLLGLLFYRFGVSAWSLAAAPAVLVLVQVLVFDARHRLILNLVMYPSSALALLASPFNPLIHGIGMTWHGRVLSALLGAAVAGGGFFLISLATRGGVGLGDAKLCFFLGAVLGGLPLPVPQVMTALILGIFLGGAVSALLLVTRVRSMTDFIPYGPFLCAGAVLELLYPCGILGPTGCV